MTTANPKNQRGGSPSTDGLPEQIEGTARALLLATLGLAGGPGTGAALAALVGQLWTGPAIRRIDAFCGELDKRVADVEAFRRKMEEHPHIQAGLSLALEMAPRLTSSFQIERVAQAAANLDKIDPAEAEAAAFLLRILSELDGTELRLLYSMQADPRELLPSLGPPGPLPEQQLADSPPEAHEDLRALFEARLAHLERLGLIRPLKPEKVETLRRNRRKLAHDMFRATRLGHALRRLTEAA